MPTLLDRGKLVGEGLSDVIPIDYIIDWFRSRITRRGIVNRVLILKSETASGKSTVLPSRLYNARVGDPLRGMIVTQPRVVTAIENVNEIRKHNSAYTPRDIGHSTKYDKLRPDRYGILSASIGTLTRELETNNDDAIIKRYQYIIIDEAHERSVQLDLTLISLFNLLTRCENRDDCPFVVLASATFDEHVFLDFFGVPRETNFIWCRGAPQPIDERWSFMGDHTSSNYLQTCADAVNDIVRDGSDADVTTGTDVLIFLPGKPEMQALRDLLEPLRVGLVRRDPAAAFDIILLESSVVNEYSRDYQRIFNAISDSRVIVDGKQYTPTRRIILSTNVAETGLTLSGLRYVIDSGYAREVEYNATVNAAGLLTRPAPQSRIWQRRGRAGRNAPGVFYPTYPRHVYDRLQLVQYPDIVTGSAVDLVIMKLAAEQYRGIDDPTSIASADPFEPGRVHAVQLPGAESIGAALHVLQRCGLLRERHLTQLGVIAMHVTALPPDHVRMVLGGFYWGVQPHDLIVASAYTRAYTMKTNKIRWSSVWEAAGLIPADATASGPYTAKMRLLIGDNLIDGVILYRAIERVAASGGSLVAWCEKNGILYDKIVAFSDMVDEGIEQFTLANMRVFLQDVDSIVDALTADSVARFKHCVYDGFAHNMCVVDRATRRYTQCEWSQRPVRVPALLADTTDALGVKLSVLPKYVICPRFEIKEDARAGKISLSAPHVCVLDGYVSPDLQC